MPSQAAAAPPLLLLAAASALLLAAAHSDPSPSCSFGDHHHDGGHHHHHHHSGHSPSCSFSAGDHHRHHDHGGARRAKLPEELAEEEDLKLYGFESHHDHEHDHDHHVHGGSDLELSGLGLWVPAMGCSLLVSLASLICLIILPLIFVHGKPSKAVVDALAVFGAGAMLGDAFLHQLPHAFGGQHSHSHEHHISDLHDHHERGHSHAHSLKDLSVGLSILFGIVIFLLVEKVVRYVEDHSRNGAHNSGHGHHHHHHKLDRNLKDDNGNDDTNPEFDNSKDCDEPDISSEKKLLAAESDSDSCLNDEKHHERETVLRKRVTSSSAASDDKKEDVADRSIKKSPSNSSLPSSLVFGYLNLFSDGVHNFTDGMALGSAFLFHGTVGGWSRTLFLLAHELPQEVGDFGILVRSGFTVSKALFFNFLSALVALAGTALALVLGKDPGHSSLIEGFTAGGFIYIAVAGVLPEMNNEKTTFKSTAVQLTSLILGMGVALCISLVE